ncbi:thiol:disulfide interchange protein DsbD [Pseudoduganella lurida]|uniref:Thiol:disulfide interchange protein DsbD n=1 Tax=Pseudoduganella lurida TaxID=1036180 RepID=A0A562QX98_9BURK|nr:protein-disulfide reductase DsbD N-terminal domain-containing protein [Pseudoduganella lurida]TWI60756.1 thiol:disulfide interchange protein DsbD [Pseudoduganella lurida]
MSFLSRTLVLPLVLCSLASSAGAVDDFLDPQAAFRFSARMADANTLEATWTIAEGYYMYRERFAFKADSAQLGAPHIPPGKMKFDETFNKEVEMYRHKVTIRVPVKAGGQYTLAATGQGCADKGLCYAPQTVTVQLSATGESAPRNKFGLPAAR